MTAQIIDGKALAQEYRNNLKKQISALPTPPKLAVIIVGADAASQIYVKNKEKACEETGIQTKTFRLTEDIAAEELKDLIKELNEDITINGILVQLPLPAHLNEKEILQTIDPKKDVDGFHPINGGLLFQKQAEGFTPCTPKGIIALLHQVKQDLTGLNAVVIGRSKIVGLPTALLLLQENCTVTITHSKTKNLKEICRNADILVAAIGKPEFITKDYIKPNAILIDVGINRSEKGLVGDIKRDASEIASYITPVPGGVGPMTIAMLLENTYLAFLNQQHS